MIKINKPAGLIIHYDYVVSTGIRVIWRKCSDDVGSVRSGGMTGSLRLSALLLLLLSRWASADLEKGEDEFVRSWVIIEEQLVPPSRDELLSTGGGAGTVGAAAAGAAAGRRITPKSVFVAPSFNKCSDGYRPDSMGRCIKVVKLNQTAQLDFLYKQFNSMYGAGAGFPAHAAFAAYRPVPPAPTTTTEPSAQKTDSPGPFQLNIPLAGVDSPSSSNQTAETADGDDDATGITTMPAMPSVNPDPGTVFTATTSTTPSTVVTTAAVPDSAVDQTATAPDAGTDVPVATGGPPRPHRHRYQTSVTDEDATVTTSAYDTTTDAKIK